MVSIIDRHAGPVGRRCRTAPIKKPSYLPMLPSKNPHEPKLFPETHPTRHSSFSIPAHPWF
jgi:hypothetical protein